MRVLTAAGARAADAAAQAAGVPVALLMEQAGVAVAAAAERHFAPLRQRGAVVLAGQGSNGGDGLVAARALADRGWPVVALVAGGPRRFAARAAAQRAYLARLAGYGVPVLTLDGATAAAVLDRHPGALVVDAVSGTGVRGPLRAEAATALAAARERGGAVLAVDLPTGVDPDTGRVSAGAVAADRTVAMAFLKPGHLLWPGAGLCGAVEVAPIGLGPFADASGEAAMEWVTEAEARALAPERTPTLHKGEAGRILVVAGSPGFGGAAVLATLGALASGAGLVTAATPPEVRAALLARAPAAMALADDADLEVRAAAADAVAMGPGLGRGPETVGRVRAVLARARRLVLDADALTALAGLGEAAWRELRRSPAAAGGALVLTPHPGEAATLLAVPDEGRPVWPEGSSADAAAVDAGRLEAARALARASGAVVLLKGRPTAVAHPDGRLRLNGSGGPVLATGGTGDVLTGLVGGLLAQGLDAFDAAALGAYLHGRAGEQAAEGGDRGVTAAEVAAALPAAWRLLLAGDEGSRG